MHWEALSKKKRFLSFHQFEILANLSSNLHVFTIITLSLGFTAYSISETARHAYKVVKSRLIVAKVSNRKNTKNKYKNKLQHISLANSGKT